MERKKSMAIKSMVFVVNLIVFLSVTLLFIEEIILFEAFMALLFIQAFVSGLSLFLYIVYKRFSILEKRLGFTYIRGTALHPKFEGHYKDNWWQVHFVSRETGSQWGIPMTYVKLQWEKSKKFYDSKLAAYKGYKYRGNDIVEVKHIIRPHKNYLLLKRKWFLFNHKKIQDLMDLLLKVAKEAEKK